MAFGDSGLTRSLFAAPRPSTGVRSVAPVDPRPLPVPEYGPVEDGFGFDPDDGIVNLKRIDHQDDEHYTAWEVVAAMCQGMDASLPDGPYPDFTVKQPFALEDLDPEDIAEADIDYRVVGMDTISPFPQTFVLSDDAGEFDRFVGRGMTFEALRARISSKISARLRGSGRWGARMTLTGREIGVGYVVEN